MRLDTIPRWLYLLTVLILIGGCSSKEYVRHLASDACLITPQKSTKQEIQAYFGPPDRKQTLNAGNEEWTYFQQNKSLLRKTPYVGTQLGTEHYDVLIVTFRGDMVELCQYRLLSDKEFKDSKIDTGPKPDAD
ncbi:MAG: hypothetical protein KKD63_07620 [Proteobacteria bacterium]|nr:hypothetical protein [Desulfobulbaceae bacterium]MBU4152732.1 hypothetical protein [Pseudomonadota bacterium]